MTASKARTILEEAFPVANINEVTGNPNMLGWFLFTVNDEEVFVTDDGHIVRSDVTPTQAGLV